MQRIVLLRRDEEPVLRVGTMRLCAFLMAMALGCSSEETTSGAFGCEDPPRQALTFYCWSYGGYANQGDLCLSDADCVSTGAPCTEAACVDGACVAVDYGYRKRTCGGSAIDTLWCNGPACCGWSDVPPLWDPSPCATVHDCPTPNEEAPMCVRRSCVGGVCSSHPFTNDGSPCSSDD